MELIAGAPGYGPPEGKCPSDSVVCRKIVGVLPRATFVDGHRCNSRVGFGSLQPFPKRVILCCKSSSRALGRNPDFPRHNKHGFSRGKNLPMEEKESFDMLNEVDSYASKNGSILSIPSSPRPQVTAVPGPREKEIVELFRKVQAQLRERAAVRKEKKSQDGVKGKGKENETVDSLLKLLKKHSVEQTKRKSIGATIRNPSEDQTEQITPSFPDRSRDTAQHPNNNASHSRPISNFRRKSPIPRVRYPPSNLETESDMSQVMMHPEPEDEPELEPKPELGEEHDADQDPVFSDEAVYNHMSDSDNTEQDESESIEYSEEQDQFEAEDLTKLKLVELRALAKSRGIKGFSKMKKSDLLELLSGSSV
ncbi:hypothetical protein SAY87_012173 [Trapa incisa]|uniref:Rho termination factor-like N-terminal domain-containing protein n=2 Tax=Trapa TaxID=22665 RepID=A0AAN7R9W6_TRANT|nr:hypothetical protein SAY87_012173 [Trapa incisa]KAK4797359.1 hypothetical protein SAY86_029685 [Trapa natans]